MCKNNRIIKPMQAADLDAVLEIQAQAYQPYFHEARACFAEKLRLYRKDAGSHGLIRGRPRI